jgi:CRP/FNR family transcriptional regulator, cyclic AMP receptor protein
MKVSAVDRTDEDASPPSASIPEWLRVARGYGFLARLPDGLVLELVSGGQRVEYPAGGVGLRWDEQPKAAIVLRGSARAFLAYPDGNQVTTRYLRPGDMSGVFADRQPKIARGIQALEPCELLIIESGRLKQLSLAHSAIAWALVEELTSVLNMTQRSLYVRAFASVRQRVAMAIMDRARLAGEVVAGQTITGTQSELATAAGTVREVVATALQGFKRESLVDVRRGVVVILDPARLEHEANGKLDLNPS